MTWLLRKLPFSDKAEDFTVGSVKIRLKPYQIPVCVTVCRRGQVPYDPKAPLLPAILDTGFNGGFCIRDEQLRSWGGIDPRMFRREGGRNLSRGQIDVRAANIWLHRNVPHSSEPDRGDAFRMELVEGIHVFRVPADPTAGDPRPELPLLGMHALRRHDLVLAIDFRRALVALKKPRLFFLAWGI
jgi:hypothetical protein